ncbi:MAG: response regulator, partial [Aquabacterium sp.]|nr:response regulator [Aquabacterium sp.]
IEAARLDAERRQAADRARAEAQRRTAPPAAPSSPAADTPIVVMVVDDSKVVRVKTSRVLARAQYQVLLADDGTDAVKQLESTLPHVLITDVEMPEMDGFALTRHVRGHARTAHIPVIMITSSDDKHRTEAQAAGVSVLLGKPYEEDDLLARIQALLPATEAA